MRIFALRPKVLICALLIGMTMTVLLSKLVYHQPQSGKLQLFPEKPTDAVTTEQLEEKLRTGEKIEENNSKLAELIRFKYIVQFKRDLPYSLQDEGKKDFSRGQSTFIEEILGSKKSGFFIDIGAGDGESESISLYLERELKWRGLLIEPDPDRQQDLALKNRKVDILEGCINNEKFAAQKKISGGKILDKGTAGGADLSAVKVMCFPFFAVLTALGRRKVDLLTLDVNGRELEILRTIPFPLLEIELISVEFEEDIGKDLMNFMKEQGYKAVNLMDNRILDKRDLIFQRR